MVNLLPLFLTLLTLSCLGQQWSGYKFDDNLKVSIPGNFEVVDTLGQHIVSARIDNASIMIQRLPNTGVVATSIQSKEELIKLYKEFVKGVIGENGTLIDQDVSEMNGLQVIRFSSKATMGEETQIRHYLVCFLRDNWYAVQFWEVEAFSNELQVDRDRLFSSVEFPADVSVKSQYSNAIAGSPGYVRGFMIGKILGYLLMAGIVAAIIFAISRRKKKTDSA